MKNVNLVFCLHMHQPVGNLPEVVDRITAEVYRPVIEVLEKHPGVAVNLHVSGSLLEGLAERHPDLVKKIKGLVATGRVEMLSGGFYEPVLVEWPEEDRDGQLNKMGAWLQERLGASPPGHGWRKEFGAPRYAGHFIERGYSMPRSKDLFFCRQE